ncbi:hypothetical protein H310_09563 [Aphanomyces invadans]|uniref:RxLR effector protein n=1 Tax=Aphanomyces invadans TaxID=157072 RepID=A0A024TVM2_9STRA|nr:hypothetical protein H310_09563 [Aphanomyces invadans]ETV97676.1 hypothetical protein H310_09563 [Aphanomyces invadans]|eukprot:XP_008873885.1 hypothetical protein H310_09563 [Aphanomyces invadans]
MAIAVRILLSLLLLAVWMAQSDIVRANVDSVDETVARRETKPDKYRRLSKQQVLPMLVPTAGGESCQAFHGDEAQTPTTPPPATPWQRATGPGSFDKS